MKTRKLRISAQRYLWYSRYWYELRVWLWLLVVSLRVWIGSCRSLKSWQYLIFTSDTKPSYEYALILW